MIKFEQVSQKPFFENGGILTEDCVETIHFNDNTFLISGNKFGQLEIFRIFDRN